MQTITTARPKVYMEAFGVFKILPRVMMKSPLVTRKLQLRRRARPNYEVQPENAQSQTGNLF